MAGIFPLSVPYAEGGLPPAKILKTSDEYTKPTDWYFTIKSQKVALQGHPFFAVKDSTTSTVKVPWVSPQQYRVMELHLPCPNNFSISQNFSALQDEKFIWQLKGFRINREGVLRAGVESNKKFDLAAVVLESESVELFNEVNETSKKLVFDPPAAQHIVVGCKPTLGVHYDFTQIEASQTPLLKPVQTEIRDGDLSPMGFGNININTLKAQNEEEDEDLNQTKRENFFPSTMVYNPEIPCKMISDIDMTMEETGDRNFIHIHREQSYSKEYMESGKTDYEQGGKDIFSTYWNLPSGSVISSLNDIFNKNYWLNKGEHQNNCLAWDDIFFFTVMDNTRGGSIVFPVQDKICIRHIEIYQLEVVVRLVKVKLEAELIQYLYRINRNLLTKWGYGWNVFQGTQGSGSSFSIGPIEEKPLEEENEEELVISANIKVDFNGEVHSDLRKTLLGTEFHAHLKKIQDSFQASLPRPRGPAKKMPVKRKAKA